MDEVKGLQDALKDYHEGTPGFVGLVCKFLGHGFFSYVFIGDPEEPDCCRLGCWKCTPEDGW